MKYAEIERPADGVALVRLNRPERLNALSPSLVGDLITAFRSLNRERGIRAIVLTGAGRAFCSGADLSGEPDPAPDAEGRGKVGLVYRTQEHLVDLMLAVHECEKPVIAAVHGAAVGGGLALALASDLRVADETAKFGSVFIKVGLSSADVGTSYLLPRLVGPTRAAELMLTGRHFSAAEADRFGMLNALTPAGGHLDAALELAGQIAQNSEYGVWMTKKGLWSGIEAHSMRQQLELENRTQVLGTFTGNMTEAAAAFRERRAPVWEDM
ncbi:enoyl-CoA hydratase/isomerase family protein [Yinghuangia soli]|uniref:Enoyl-CoA hydratase/isomerase family protein n=1 Tax=Yinghuangia soli TaxID=2908204 RepID=A0AA41U3B3_9ACTN|nr:enoyl-CoA hydratase/isomerase family protein [Yinghuangia soli]MCF2527909.1 enoyl-CoA hydratase/isomerase family protein [Yinghuangia soli]